MTDEEILEAFRHAHAILTGHFVLTSGRHSDTYVQCARVLEDPNLTSALAREIVERLDDRAVDLVIAPAMGGVIIGFAVAQALDVRFIFTERKAGTMQLRRGFSIAPGERALVVEDVVTTGGSVAEVIDIVKASGGIVAGVASLIDRGGPKPFTERLQALLRLEVESWEPERCALCAAGMPTESPGSRRLRD